MKLWSRWVALLERRETGEALALFRVAVGLVCLYTVLTVVLDGLVPVLWLGVEHGGYRNFTGKTWWLVDALGGPQPATVWGLVAVALLASTALAVGWWSRLAALLAGQTIMGLTWINGAAGGSYDELISNACWILVLAESDATLSLRARLRGGAWRSAATVLAWPRYLAIGQLALVYGSTGVQKVSAYWTPGGDFSALYYVLQQPTWHRMDMRWVAWIFPLTQLATALTWFWEWGAPLLVLAYYYRDTRTRPGRLRAAFNRLDARALYALVGVVLHLSVFASMEVGPFTWITLSYYLCLWHPEEWRARWPRLAPAPASPSGSTAPQTG